MSNKSKHSKPCQTYKMERFYQNLPKFDFFCCDFTGEQLNKYIAASIDNLVFQAENSFDVMIAQTNSDFFVLEGLCMNRKRVFRLIFYSC